MCDDEFWATQSPVLERAMASGDYPALARLSEDSFGAGWEQTFGFGLDRLLDGVEALVTRRRERVGSAAARSPVRWSGERCSGDADTA